MYCIHIILDCTVEDLIFILAVRFHILLMCVFVKNDSISDLI